MALRPRDRSVIADIVLEPQDHLFARVDAVVQEEERDARRVAMEHRPFHDRAAAIEGQQADVRVEDSAPECRDQRAAHDGAPHVEPHVVAPAADPVEGAFVLQRPAHHPQAALRPEPRGPRQVAHLAVLQPAEHLPGVAERPGVAADEQVQEAAQAEGLHERGHGAQAPQRVRERSPFRRRADEHVQLDFVQVARDVHRAQRIHEGVGEAQDLHGPGFLMAPAARSAAMRPPSNPA